MKLTDAKGILTNALPVIATYAPTISRAIGGPVGIAFSYILPVLFNAFGVQYDDVTSLANAITTDESAPNKLQKIEKDHAECLTEMMKGLAELACVKLNLEINWK
jgi:hypothetical protein